MTEQKLLQLQASLADKGHILVLVNGFYQAYGPGAYALSRALHYRVVRRWRPWGEVLTCGFPEAVLGKACLRLRKTRADIELLADNTFLVYGLDGTPDETMVWDAVEEPEVGVNEEPTVCVAVDWLADAVTGFDTHESTPSDAIHFIGMLQRCMRLSTTCIRYQP